MTPSRIAAASPAVIADAAARLAAGELVAFPTETVYGLGADAGNAAAVRAIFAAKGRPADHPVIVHVADMAAVGHWTHGFGGDAQRLAEAFWPGPLTLILPRAGHVDDAVTGGQASVGVRMGSSGDQVRSGGCRRRRRRAAACRSRTRSSTEIAST